MSSKFNTLLHGSPEDVLGVLEVQGLDDMEVKAALSNAFKHINTLTTRQDSEISRLENQLERAFERIDTLESDLKSLRDGCYNGFSDLDMWPL